MTDEETFLIICALPKLSAWVGGKHSGVGWSCASLTKTSDEPHRNWTDCLESSRPSYQCWTSSISSLFPEQIIKNAGSVLPCARIYLEIQKAVLWKGPPLKFCLVMVLEGNGVPNLLFPVWRKLIQSVSCQTWLKWPHTWLLPLAEPRWPPTSSSLWEKKRSWGFVLE